MQIGESRFALGNLAVADFVTDGWQYDSSSLVPSLS